jgi:hypothetical protein
MSNKKTRSCKGDSEATNHHSKSLRYAPIISTAQAAPLTKDTLSSLSPYLKSFLEIKMRSQLYYQIS